jgi:hypothetical protein
LPRSPIIETKEAPGLCLINFTLVVDARWSNENLLSGVIYDMIPELGTAGRFQQVGR